MKHRRWIIFLTLILLLSSFTPQYAGLAGADAPVTKQQTVITLWRETPYKAQGLVVGDVKKVLAGSLAAPDYKILSLKKILFALGAGTPDDKKFTGEMLAVGDKAYVKTTDEIMGFPVGQTKGQISTPFAVMVNKNQGPGAVYTLNSPEGITVSELYSYLLPRAKGRAGVIIYGRWRSLATTALKKAPLYNQPIMLAENRSQYFHPQEFLWDRIALACGLMVSKNSVAPAEQPLLSRMFYVNFANAPQNDADMLEHTHVLILGESKGQVVTEEKLRPSWRGKISPVRIFAICFPRVLSMKA